MKKRYVGIVCMVVGAVFLLASGALYLHNFREEQQAQIRAEGLLSELLEQMDVPVEDPPENTQTTKPSAPANTQEGVSSSESMTVVQIDGYGFIGYISLPSLGIELPVMDMTDDERLRVAPCRLNGTVASDDLVIGAHNYQSHFGRLKDLNVGDRILFTDMNGVTIYYTVASLETLQPSQVQELTSGQFPLTLYTCTYGGATRVTVRCDFASQA